MKSRGVTRSTFFFRSAASYWQALETKLAMLTRIRLCKKSAPKRPYGKCYSADSQRCSTSALPGFLISFAQGVSELTTAERIVASAAEQPEGALSAIQRLRRVRPFYVLQR